MHASELGNYEQANARFEASLAVAREVGDPEPVVLTLHNLAHQEWERGNAALAMASLEEALGVAREHHMVWILPSILVGLGTISTDLGDLDRAIGFFRESLALAARQPGRCRRRHRRTGTTSRRDEPARRGSPTVRGGRHDARGLAMPLSPSELEDVEAIMIGLRVALGDEGFSTAWADGRSLSHEEALDAALSLRAATAESTTPDAEPRTCAHVHA